MNGSRYKHRYLYIVCGSIAFIILYKLTIRKSIYSFVTIKKGFHDEYNCGCPRYNQPIRKSGETSLCGDDSTSRGKNQSIIAYTIYGDYKNKNIWKHYYNQIEQRLKEVNTYYDGWTVRLYHNFSLHEDIPIKLLCNLYCTYPNFDICNVHNIQVPNSWLKEFKTTFNVTEIPFKNQFFEKIFSYFNSLDDSIKFNTNEKIKRIKNGEKTFDSLLPGKLWRFLPLGDSYVTKFLVRDVDSFILEREVAAVQEWLNNYETLIHAMRDHPSHNGFILAGMWGSLRTKDEKKLTQFLKKIIISPTKDVWDYDQILLRRIIWPDVVNEIVIHDSYHCKNSFLTLKGNIVLPFPTQRQGKMFVSWGPTRSKSELNALKPCPSSCRPKNHQDWEYC